jgi:ADP-heptose:LPS heptosyltransferase
MEGKFVIIMRSPVFYFLRGLRKLDNKLTVGFLGRIRKSSRVRADGASEGRLVFILENIGDAISATPVLNRLAENDWVVCTKYNRAVIDLLGLKNVLVLNRDPGIFDFMKVLVKLRKKAFPDAIVLDSSRSGGFGVVASRFVRTGKIYSGFDARPQGDVHVTEVCVDDGETDILSLAKASVASDVFALQDKRLEKKIDLDCSNEFERYRDFIGIHIGGLGSINYSVSRQYPEHHIFELVRMLLDRGSKVLITGDGSDAKRFKKYADRLAGERRFEDFSGKLDIARLACLLKSLSCFVTPDNGTLHLAQAVGCRKIFAVLGPSSPTLVRGNNTEIIRMDLPCSPCLEFLHFPPRCVSTENNACLSLLLPSIIVKRVLSCVGS